MLLNKTNFGDMCFSLGIDDIYFCIYFDLFLKTTFHNFNKVHNNCNCN